MCYDLEVRGWSVILNDAVLLEENTGICAE